MWQLGGGAVVAAAWRRRWQFGGGSAAVVAEVAAACGDGGGDGGSDGSLAAAAETLRRRLGTVVAAAEAAWQQQLRGIGSATSAATSLSRYRHRRSLRAAATALPPSRSFEPKALQRRSTYGRNRLAHRKMDIMLGTRLCAGITIEIRMRPRPLYAFRVILLMPRYAYAAYPTVVM